MSGVGEVVYLDNNATTMVAPEVLEEMLPYFCEKYGNPSSMHEFGGQVAKKLEEARERVAALLGAEPTEIVFTGCGTESDNHAIRGTLEAYPDRRHVVTTRVEHPAVRTLGKYLAGRGYNVTELPVDAQGMLEEGEFEASLHEGTAIASIMWANNETGVMFPVERLAELAHERGVVFHTDAVQAVGKVPMKLRDTAIDLLSLSGHKLHAPKGVGALYVRRGTRIRPLIIGGHQERTRRGGTENTASIIGLGKACELAMKAIEEERTRVRRLRDKLECELLARAPNARVNGHREQRLPNTSSISFEYVEGEAILLMLSQLGICASSGSACTSGSLEPSHVLRAMGVPFSAAHGSIRFSLSRYTTEEEVEYAIEHVPQVVKRLREISPFGRGAAERDAAMQYGEGLAAPTTEA
ncbi:MAG: cysteine desulfurase NifS [Armatimonadota bacterium]